MTTVAGRNWKKTRGEDQINSQNNKLSQANQLAFKQTDVPHLSSHHNYLRQLDYICADCVKYVLQFVYNRYEGLH